MCGICGLYNFQTGKPINKETLEKMSLILHQRGPDDAGFYVNDNIGIGFRRLSIIDIEGGHQPISNETGTIFVVLNGEIYNFREIRQDLLKKQHRFKTRTDAEVIVHLYEDYGLDFVNYLNGMFAIALWDNNNHQLVLVRDRIGIKPLFYYVNRDGIQFASEMKALISCNECSKRLNPTAIHFFFSLNYIPSPYTIYTDIKKLKPAHILVCNHHGIKVTKYWDVQISCYKEDSLDFHIKKTREMVFQSISLGLVSDTPIGLFLSGGIDSSILCGVYSQLCKEKIKSFSVGFAEPSYSELKYARIIAKKFNTDHYEITIPTDISSLLPELISYCDEPFADSSLIPMYFVSKLARQHVKVVLTGDGADEIFGGYETYIANRILSWYKMIPDFLRNKLFKKIINALPVSHGKVSYDFKLKQFIRFADMPNIQAHASWRNIFSIEQQKLLFTDSFYTQIKNYKYYELYEEYFNTLDENLDDLNKFMYLDVKTYLPADMLVKVDRMTMMNSLEARPLFLDHNLVNYAFSISSRYKLAGWKTKFILRKAFADLLPDDILKRKKAGFNVPIPIWINTSLRDLVHDSLSSTMVRELGIFQQKYLNRLINEHSRKKHDHSHRIWGLLVFILWYMNSIKNI